jgi:hypothetical protein
LWSTRHIKELVRQTEIRDKKPLVLTAEVGKPSRLKLVCEEDRERITGILISDPVHD